MSADLFAAFDSAPQKPNSQQPQVQSNRIPVTAAAGDPFSFLSSPSTSTAQPQDNNRALQWPSLVQQTASPVSSWPTLPSAQAQSQNANVWGDLGDLAGLQSGPSLIGQKPVEKDEDEDGWGDFEVAPPEEPAQPPTVQVPRPDPGRTRIVRASTMDLMSNNLVDLMPTQPKLESWQERPSWEAPTKQKVSKRVAQNSDPSVLFDAADFDLQEPLDDDEDDDFGDFESDPVPTTHQGILAPAAKSITSSAPVSLNSGATAPTTRKQPPGLLLSNPTTKGNRPLYPQAPKSPYGSFQNRKPDPLKELRVSMPQGSEYPKETRAKSPSPVTAWPSVEDADGFGDEWAEFEDLPGDAAKPPPPTSSQPANGKKSIKTKKPTPFFVHNSALEKANNNAEIAPAGPPPTNIPPPSVLLSILPKLLDLATTSLLKPLTTQLPPASQHQVTAHPATVLFLRGHLALATVAARIVAGRKLRWRRDKFLMQGMAISAAGNKGGMKLAGVDKTQSAREDREAAEVVAVWEQQLGRLRAAVAAANSAAAAAAVGSKGGDGQLLRVPELTLNVSAHVVPMVATAPKPCVICGLRRDERIAKVDFDVEDSFGEWWVEFWGHRACKNFWVEHEGMLRQR
ncbi:hypothetical protein B0T17DRAFT_507049 [Bombardia bombarda]|uniref:Uncharacterized protein n=1 Tax=Bombardia bombarda TaxID=252184 RepID=A0AA39XAY4_9PEZI|nr:hypothetical protein B0T17DRAFT_507049 [Bombardia bombarda]